MNFHVATVSDTKFNLPKRADLEKDLILTKPLLLLNNLKLYFYLKKNLIDVFFHETIQTLDLTTLKINTEITFILCKFHYRKASLSSLKMLLIVHFEWPKTS